MNDVHVRRFALGGAVVLMGLTVVAFGVWLERQEMLGVAVALFVAAYAVGYVLDTVYGFKSL